MMDKAPGAFFRDSPEGVKRRDVLNKKSPGAIIPATPQE